MTVTVPETVADVLSFHARLRPTAVAIEAFDRVPATYAALVAQAERTRLALRSFGVGPTDRVAIVLPDGADTAVMFLSVAACAVAAPLNPAYRDREFAFHLDSLAARAVVVPAGSIGGVVDVAYRRGIAVIEMSRRNDHAGAFELSCDRRAGTACESASVTPDALALLLHTSGTTARPKLVPLTHANICAAAHQNAAVVELGPDDRSLAVTPLFHVGGLICAVLSPLYAGGSVVCTPGFHAPHFLDWLRAYEPTWYGAVPTMQRAIVDQARQRGSGPIQSKLRFIQAGSAAMDPGLPAELERVFGVPVLARYGMTETSGPIAASPLPPRVRKPGSVGIATGVDIAVIDEHGRTLGQNQVGEIVVRGANVMGGYERNPEANAIAFVNGWFRTGDQGYQDEDGYFFITGRLKEIINRGGEKISPREIDDVLLEHPSITQAVTFAMPDSQLGETVAAAVVVRPGAQLDQRELRGFVANRLAFFKVPARIVVLDELPKGPTGKVQRIGLAERLGLLDRARNPLLANGKTDLKPLGSTGQRVARIVADVLALPEVGVDEDFFELGGDSLKAMQVMARIQQQFAVEVSVRILFDAPTIGDLTAAVDASVIERTLPHADAHQRLQSVS